jgi:hypothetical protein
VSCKQYILSPNENKSVIAPFDPFTSIVLAKVILVHTSVVAPAVFVNPQVI